MNSHLTLLPATAALDRAYRVVWQCLNASHGHHFATAFLTDFAPQVLAAASRNKGQGHITASSVVAALLNSKQQPLLEETIMDYQKLLFAAAVYNLAAHMRDREHPLDYMGDLDPDEFKTWLEKYPLSSYVPQALASFKAVAKQIERIEGVS